MSKYLFFYFLCITHSINAQLTDNFSDGDFTHNPKWLGEVIDFKVDNSNRLQLFAPTETSAKVLYTNSSVSDSAFWKMDVFLGFNPSSANYLECYLVAENENFTSCNALYFKLGGSKDNIELYSRQNGTESIITKTSDGLFPNDSVALSIQITKVGGTFTIDTATIGSNSFVTLATSSPISYTPNAQFFGLRCVFTSTRSKKFYFDNFEVEGSFEKQKPTIDSVLCSDENSLKLVVNEALNRNSVSESNFVLNDQFMPTSISYDSLFIALKFDHIFSQTSYDQLRISNLSDLLGNTMVDTTLSFYCGAVESPQAGDLVINEIMADPTPAFVLPPVEFIELYNASSKTIALSNAKLFNDATEYIMSTDTLLFPNTYYTITHASNIASLRAYGIENLISATSFPALSNDGDSLSIVSNSGDIIDIVSYRTDAYSDSKKNGGYSLERINFNEHCNNIHNFKYSTNTSQATPSEQNSVADTSITKFELIHAFWENTQQLSLQFSHALNTSLLNSNSFVANGINSNSIRSNNERYVYTAPFPSAFQPNKIIPIELNAIANCLNGVLDTTFSLKTPIPSDGSELHITELMVDPTPSVGLPDGEYIELYNSSNYDVLLSDFTLIYNADTFALPTVNLNANTYTILIDAGDTAKFNGFTYEAINHFPSLLNSKGSLALHHSVSNTSERIEYIIQYYQDVEKRNGGYSLESVRINENCLGKLNFKASMAEIGGTPAQQNSVFEATRTTSLPSVESHTFSGTSLDIVWDRNIQFSSSFSANSLQLEPVAPLFLERISNDSLSIVFPSLELGTTYTLSVADIIDCKSNSIDTVKLTITPSREPTYGDLVITEIMADPSPSYGLPEVEYFELYNPTSESMSLNELTLNGIDLDLNYSLPPKTYVAISRNELSNTNSLVANNLSTTFFTNSGKHLELHSGTSLIIELDYNINWHSNALGQNGGISLELLNSELNCYNNKLFWASSIASKGGTPGKPNSNGQDSFPKAEQTLIYYKNQTLSFAFNAPIQSTEIPPSLIDLTDSSYLSLGQSQINFALKNSLNLEPTRIDFQVKNCNSNDVIVIDEAIGEPQTANRQNILINEIMFDPKPNQSEYIELRNATKNHLLLNGLYLNTDIPEFDGKIIDTLGLVIRPNAYIFLSKDTANNQSNYSHINPLKWYPYFTPSLLNNSGSFIGLHNVLGHYIDSVHYSNTMHYPLLKNTQGVALERISSGTNSNTNDVFTSAAQNSGFATPGLKNSAEIETKPSSGILSLSDDYLSANGDGYQDAIQIKYSNKSEEVINLLIYDRAGFVIKTIAQNHFHTYESSFIWKGDTDDNQIPESGVYILVLTVESNGSTKGKIKRVVTVSR